MSENGDRWHSQGKYRDTLRRGKGREKSGNSGSRVGDSRNHLSALAASRERAVSVRTFFRAVNCREHNEKGGPPKKPALLPALSLANFNVARLGSNADEFLGRIATSPRRTQYR
jgi:hypothetical protein